MSRIKKIARLRKAGRGSVLLIATLLVSSAVLRLASGVAMAEDAKPLALPDMVKEAAMDGPTDGTETPSAPHDRAGKNRLLEALQEREARLLERERKLEMRTKALSVADEEIAKRMADLKEAESALRATLSLADGAAENDLARLTTVYESMKPKDTAALFQTMEPGFAAGFLGRMRPDVAAAVMTGLPPDVAYSISVIMAGRNANVPKT